MFIRHHMFILSLIIVFAFPFIKLGKKDAHIHLLGTQKDKCDEVRGDDKNRDTHENSLY